jgi:ribonucleoside-diphosphate reductase alpha chain
VGGIDVFHRRFAPFYIRRVRMTATDPLAVLMRDQGLPCEPDAMQPNNLVFSFPIASPPSTGYADDVDALTQCKLWKVYVDNWADHSVSCTINYNDDEFLGLGQWVWEHFDAITGLSFLPRADHSYVQAPYEAVNRAVRRSSLRCHSRSTGIALAVRARRPNARS